MLGFGCVRLFICSTVRLHLFFSFVVCVCVCNVLSRVQGIQADVADSEGTTVLMAAREMQVGLKRQDPARTLHHGDRPLKNCSRALPH